MELAASFDAQLSSLAPFIFYLVIGAIVFIETGLLFGFFLPGDSILFSAGLVAAAHGNINIVILVSIIFLAAFFGDQVGFVIGRVVGRPYLDKKQSPRMQRMIVNAESFYDKTGWWGALLPLDPYFCPADRWRCQDELLQILIRKCSWCTFVGCWNYFGWLLRSDAAMCKEFFIRDCRFLYYRFANFRFGKLPTPPTITPK